MVRLPGRERVRRVDDLKEMAQVSIRASIRFGPTIDTRLPTWKADESLGRGNVGRFSGFRVGINRGNHLVADRGVNIGGTTVRRSQG